MSRFELWILVISYVAGYRMFFIILYIWYTSSFSERESVKDANLILCLEINISWVLFHHASKLM